MGGCALCPSRLSRHHTDGKCARRLHCWPIGTVDKIVVQIWCWGGGGGLDLDCMKLSKLNYHLRHKKY